MLFCLMSDYDNAIFRLATEAEPQPEDYTGEDGILYCGNCRQPKEAYFTEGKSLFGRDRHPKECDCQRKRREKQESTDRERKSTFLRRLILYGFVYDIDYSDLREYNYTLGKISGNLNQIAKRMNATGNVYKADVEEVKKLMKQVWDTQKSMLAKQPSMRQ